MKYKNELFFLRIQRKDTIGFIDLVRGKYADRDTDYIRTLCTIMTRSEHELLLTKTFDELWNTIWVNNTESSIRKYKRCFIVAKRKFNFLKEGYIDSKTNENITLKSIVDKCDPYFETEWGFPKGRRERNETNMQCAFREVYEETGLKINKDYILRNDYKPIKLTFVGINKLRYQHLFYVGEVKDFSKFSIRINKRNRFQTSEIRDIKWFTIQDIYKQTRHYNKHEFVLIKNIMSLFIKKEL